MKKVKTEKIVCLLVYCPVCGDEILLGVNCINVVCEMCGEKFLIEFEEVKNESN